MPDLKIRTATKADREGICAIGLAAFDPSENELVARLAVELLDEIASPPTISLAAEEGGALVGHVAFSAVWMKADGRFVGRILSPLAVRPERQKGGIGSALVREGLQESKRLGARIVFVYGDPGYYGRFGFTADQAQGYEAPHALQYPHGWLAFRLDQEKFAAPPGALECVHALRKPELW